MFDTDESRSGTSRVSLLGELAKRSGHARPSMFDVYSHIMPPDEVPAERFLSLLIEEGRR